MTPANYIGLMSGTSLDGIDAVLVDFQVEQPRLLQRHFLPYDDNLRRELLALSHAERIDLHAFLQIDVRLGRLYARAVQALLDKARMAAERVAAIGSHGQTLRHHPQGTCPYTLQLGDPNTLAELTGITTVADFRRRDVAAGGQGAPLVPAFHAALLQQPGLDRIVLNLGGMANITCLPGAGDRPVSGFDTGPGNVLLDGWIMQHQGCRYDAEGRWAAAGEVLPELLERLLDEPYFARPAPKSTGRELFSLSWLRAHLRGNESPVDVQATLLELTAASVAQAVAQQAADEVWACGGGVKNSALMQRLGARLAPRAVRSTAELGIDPQSIEAMAFAWLARQTLQGGSGNLPAVTGARRAVVLGGIYPR